VGWGVGRHEAEPHAWPTLYRCLDDREVWVFKKLTGKLREGMTALNLASLP